MLHHSADAFPCQQHPVHHGASLRHFWTVFSKQLLLRAQGMHQTARATWKQAQGGCRAEPAPVK